MKSVLPAERIERIIYLVRTQKVMLDSDLAELYDVPTHRLNEQVKRNKDRFPNDFIFQLSEDEWNNLSSQIASSKRGGRRYLPYVFTEQGVAMLSSVLQSKRAVQVNIEIMRTFVRLRQLILSNEDMSRRLNELEKKYDTQFKIVFEAISQLMAPEKKPKYRIGFQSGDD